MKTRILLFFVVCSFLISPFKGQAQAANVQDSLALVDLYDSTGGLAWNFGFNWLAGPVQNWWGISLDTNGRVTSISLSNFGLKGKLPSSLGNLTQLVTLYLNNNNLNGSIPYSFGRLTNLRTLYLDNNQLTDSIPSSFGNLFRLGYLHLNNNQLTGSIPISVLNMSSMVEMNLNNNQLTGIIPVYIGNYLTELEYLNLSSNHLIGNIPVSFGAIRYLQNLSLSNNQLTGSIPSELGNIAYLQSLSLNNNLLNGDVPPSLGYITNLQTLNLSYNQLNDTIPATLGSLINLQYLFLNNNHFSGNIPLSLGNLSHAQNIRIDSNYFTFSSLEPIAKVLQPGIIYSPQDTLLPIYFTNKKLVALAGGTLSNNTYKWYNGSVLVKTVTGDSSFTPAANGNYSVAITNDLVKSLVLLSDTIALPVDANKQDSLALVNLYNSTNGSKWLIKTGWLKSPVSNWYGITLNNYGRVTAVNLAADGLKGTIPASMGTLADLIELNLDSNQLGGVIPVSFGNLVNLINLTLNNNQLSDTIPASLGNLSKLLYLNLCNNKLTGRIPSTLGGLASLKTLALSNNKLNNTIPASLGNLTKLSYLSMEHNRFTFDGMELIGQTYSFATYAPQDTVVQLQYTSPVLSALGNGNTVNWYNGPTLISAQYLNATYTVNADGRYSAVTTDNKAPKLTLYSDTLAITVKANVADSLVLVNFFDSTNGYRWAVNHWFLGPVIGWGGIHLDVTGRVASIDLIYNNLTGQLPTSIGNLSNLQNLVLRENSITGSLPASLGNLKNLQNVDLSNNYLNDSIPASLGNLTNLQTLNLSYNQLKYNIPSSFGNLTSLTALTLSNNNLSGSIPETLGNLKSLKSLVIANSLLSGSIPATFGNLTNLQTLELWNDKLSGSLPDALGKLANLQSLQLGYDSISGSIPASFGNLGSLQSLNLSNNMLSGSLPAQLGNLANLQYLVINFIAFSGGLPSTFGNLSNLGYVNINHTNLNGSIPLTFGNLKNVYSFTLNNNQFSGSIPSFFSSFQNLQTLNLSYNYFSDSIPSALANRGFYNIDLSHNQLTGIVPDNLLSLVTAHFNISYNKLSGMFPQFAQNNYNLLDFDINHNYFTFGGLASIDNITGYNTKIYAPQDTILPLHFSNKTLSVTVDGVLSKNTYKWYRNDTLVASVTGDSTYTPTAYGRYFAAVTNDNVYALVLNSDTLTTGGDSLILPTRPATEYASYEYTDTAGWTHYYYNNGTPNNLADDTLLLSLKKNGQDIGTIGDGAFAVKLVATAGAGSNGGVHLSNPLITNTSGYWVMNRYWQVTPTHEPTKSVGVRFYYNNQDLKDINGSYPTHNLTNNKLIFYKAVGGNPDPTTNLAGATKIISILPGTVASDTSWTYHALSDTTQYGEYSVASFSGGGGGGTGNNEALPVVLINFTACLLKSDAQITWQSSQEVNTNSYSVERSLTGTGFAAVGVVEAAGSSTVTQSYKFTDYNAGFLNTSTLFYRLKIIDKDGNFTYSGIIKVNIKGQNAVFSVYPIPVRNMANITFTANAPGKYSIAITSLAGKAIKRVEGTCAAGINNIAADLQGLAQGEYIITLDGDNIINQSLKLVKQ